MWRWRRLTGLCRRSRGRTGFRAVKLAARQVLEQNSRRDKSGSRTFVGLPIVPGHLGQVWMGATPAQFFTLTGAELGLRQ